MAGFPSGREGPSNYPALGNAGPQHTLRSVPPICHLSGESAIAQPQHLLVVYISHYSRDWR